MMVKLRPLTQTDIPELHELWLKHWSTETLPNPNNKIVDSIAVNGDNRIIGYGQARIHAEFMLFLDPTTRKRERVQALKLLMLEAIRGTDRAGIETIYAYIKNPDFSLLIQNRYGFKSVIEPGELLYRRL